ncbi:YjjG family noncanonical pyrimidine nucleotidase [uncultured Anaerococcus sp.]|uniref:YjjG family noncanonical pyrimidine nucleotidase n=1 Tax=uncultured Anaerococcus sp. TaxID=293428 RepID=UPI00288BC3A3|nr:YjjG family noncanonical pyrimidine nucleotidase [uncultured Anaerococcus sp.]
MKKILWDIDGTLLNFDLAETAAINRCFEIYKLEKPTDEMLNTYKNINTKYWERLERNEVTRDEVLLGRFRDFFDLYGIDGKNVKDFNHNYQMELGKTYVFNPYGKEIVKKLVGKYDQYAVTNGSLTAQRGKLEGSELNKIFKQSFISELIGFEKPDRKFFDFVFEKIGSYQLDDYVIIGDSLTSDMLGGVNAKIKTIWFNPDKKENHLNLPIDIEISSLGDVERVLIKIFE